MEKIYLDLEEQTIWNKLVNISATEYTGEQ